MVASLPGASYPPEWETHRRRNIRCETSLSQTPLNVVQTDQTLWKVKPYLSSLKTSCNFWDYCVINIFVGKWELFILDWNKNQDNIRHEKVGIRLDVSTKTLRRLEKKEVISDKFERISMITFHATSRKAGHVSDITDKPLCCKIFHRATFKIPTTLFVDVWKMLDIIAARAPYPGWLATCGTPAPPASNFSADLPLSECYNWNQPSGVLEKLYRVTCMFWFKVCDEISAQITLLHTTFSSFPLDHIWPFLK